MKISVQSPTSDLETFKVPQVGLDRDEGLEELLERSRVILEHEVEGLSPLAVTDPLLAAKLGSRGAKVRMRDPKSVLERRRAKEKWYREEKKKHRIGRPKVHWKTKWKKQRACERRYYQKMKQVRLWDPWAGFRRKISNLKGRLGVTQEQFEQVLENRIESSRDYSIKIINKDIYNNIYNIYNIIIIDKDTNTILYNCNTDIPINT